MSKLAISAAAAVLAMSGSAFAQTAPAPATPTTPPASAMPAQPTAPSAAAQPAQPATPAPAPAAAPVAAGMSVKDNTGATIGQVSELKPDPSGAQMATIKMGTDTFTVAASSLAVQNGAAVINLTQAQLQAQIHKPS